MKKYKKILLKTYLKTMYCLGINILDLKIFDEYENYRKFISHNIRLLVINDPLEYDFRVYHIQKARWLGIYKIENWYYDRISEDMIKKYCNKHNIDYDTFYSKIKKDILDIGEESKIFKILLKIRDISYNLQEFCLFNTYFEYKASIKSMYSSIDDMLFNDEKCFYSIMFINRMCEQDETGYIEEKYYNYLYKKLGEYHLQFKQEYDLEYYRNN